MGDDETVLFAQRSVGDVADAFPQAVKVFDDAGIDYSCKGAQTLADAAVAAGYGVDELIAFIEETPGPEDAIEWSQRPLDELARYLAEDHADMAENIIPTLRELLESSARQHPELTNIRRIVTLFASLSAAITMHMVHEDRDLFSSLAVKKGGANGLPNARLSQRVLRELVEHATFREELRTMRELCLLVRDDCADEIFCALTEFSRTVHYHMHLENNILYPRAIDLENQLRRAS